VIPASQLYILLYLFYPAFAIYLMKISTEEIALQMLGGMKELILKDPGFLCIGQIILRSLIQLPKLRFVGKGAQEKALAFAKKAISQIPVIAFSEEVTETAPILSGKIPDSSGMMLI